MSETYDIAIIGAGAAGLMAAIFAGRTAAAAAHDTALQSRVIALDGAAKLGAKILVAGGGRCNVTHHAVDETAYAGSSRNAIKKVLRSFDVPRTVEFFRELGVELKREETGKLFPTTDDAHTVLNALLSAARDANAELRHPWRVASLTREPEGFRIDGGAGASPGLPPSSISPSTDEAAPPVVQTPTQSIRARRVILATGGMALPRSGSDGAGYAFARALGHTITPRVVPALVPLTVAEGSFIRELSGIAMPTTLTICSGTGKRLLSFTNSTLCTHFGLSGPGPLDISRYYFDTLHHDPAATLQLNWLPGRTTEQVDQQLVALRGVSPMRWLCNQPQGLPERLARAISREARVDVGVQSEHLTREARRALVTAITAMPVPITGNRGFTYAEVTAGGVPLSELHLDTMESRVCPGLHVIGEICDVDGRIGGFNFQWAWASGYLAGRAVAAASSR